MHRLIKIRLLRDFEHLEEGMRIVKDTWFGLDKATGFRPAADFFETPQGLVLRLELAGVAPEDISLSLAGRELTVQGLRRHRCPEGVTRFWCQEIVGGPFRRTFAIPAPFNPEAVQALFADGILEIDLPRPIARRIHAEATEGGQE